MPVLKASQFHPESLFKKPEKRNIIRVIILIITAALSYLSLVLPVSTRPSSYSLIVGDVASQEIQAPEDLTYSSEILTEQQRDSAENAIGPVYKSADPTIARQQIERLRITLNYINTIRLDSFATREQKLNDLAALTDLSLDQDSLDDILDLNETRWQVVTQEAISVLEQVMRRTIREDQYKDAQQSVLSLISFSISEDQADIIAKLVTPFVKANSLYDEEATITAKKAARDAITPILRTYIKGQIIIDRGSIITQLDLEVLEKYGLVASPDNANSYLASLSLVILLSTISGLYIRNRNLAPLNETKGAILTAIAFLVFLFISRLIIPNRTIIPYFFPIAAFGLTISSLYSIEVGIILSISLSIMGDFNLSTSFDLTIYYLISTICGILILGKGKRFINFFWSGLAVGLSGSAVILAYRLIDPNTDLLGIATLMGVSLLSGMAAASLTLLLQFFFSHILGHTTSLQLLDLSRSEHPLLQMILRKIPGSYQHSLQVANLAEQAAEAIGADALLTRVGALYHDAGKTLNPAFFIENQPPGQINTHDDMDPAASAAIIIKHVTDGVQLARKHRIPARIQDFIREHHGTLITRYQYSKALELAGNNPKAVNENLFRYPGPKPRSRETALLMLADGCEARVRAELPQNETELRAIIQKTFDYLQNQGQLDHTYLTLKDLYLAREAFITTLRNTYHPRMKYPEITPQPQESNDLELKP